MIRASLRSLLGRKVRLLMSTFAIVLGVAFVAGSFVFSDTLSRSFTALFSSTVGDVVVRPQGAMTSGGSFSALTVPADLVDDIEGRPGVARVDGNVNAFGVYVEGADGKVVGGLGPPAFGGNYTTAPSAGGDGLELLEGEPPRGRGQVALEERTAERAGYTLGDTVPILLPRGESNLSAELVGLLGFRDGGSLNGATLVVWDTATAQELFLDGEEAYSDIWVTAEEGVSQEELAESVAPVLPDRVEAATGDVVADESADDLLEAIGFITTFLLIFAGISLVVGSFLIVNTFSILVAQRSRELALLRALGASQRQVVGSVQLEALVLGVLGSTLGLGLGVLLAMALRALFGQFGLDLTGQPLVFAPRTVLVCYLVGVLVTLAAALLPALRTARIAPVQALRDDVALPESSLRRRAVLGGVLVVVGQGVLWAGMLTEPPKEGWWIGAGLLLTLLGVSSASPLISRPFLELVGRLYARLFGTVGRLAGQNAIRNPRRTTATASALMIGLALACTMAIVGDSAKASVDASIEENFVGDYVVSNVFGGEFNAGIAEEMRAVDGVADVVRQRFQIVESDGDGRGVTATDPESIRALGLRAVDGDLADLDDGMVLITEELSEDRGLEVGDTYDVTVPAGERSWEVVAVYEDNPVVFTSVLTTVGTFERAGFEPADNALIVFKEPGAGDLQAELDATISDIPIVTVKDQQEFAEERRGPIDQFVLIIFALLGLALIIAVLGIVNTLALSVIERTREVGLLRAVGLGRRQLRTMIRLESILIAVLGAVLGVVLGIFFGITLMYAVRDEGLEVISVPVGQVAVFLVLSLFIGVLAAVLPARRAARLDVLQAIATE